MTIEKPFTGSIESSNNESKSYSLIESNTNTIVGIQNQEVLSQLGVNSICESGDGIKNEDAIVLDPENGLYAVLDGVSSVSGQKINGKTGGAIASQITAQSIRESASINDGLALAQEKIHNLTLNARDNTERFGTVLAAVKIGEQSIEYTKLGDVTILAIYTDGTFTHLGTIDNHDEETLLIKKRLIESGEFESQNQEFNDKLLEVRMNGNQDYGVMNGQKEYLKFVEQGEISKNGVSDVLIFSDGLYSPSTDPSSDPDFDEIIQVYKDSGVNGLKKWIRDIEKSDPNCEKYIRFKQHDDLSIISIKIT